MEGGGNTPKTGNVGSFMSTYYQVSIKMIALPPVGESEEGVNTPKTGNVGSLMSTYYRVSIKMIALPPVGGVGGGLTHKKKPTAHLNVPLAKSCHKIMKYEMPFYLRLGGVSSTV